MLLSAVSVLVVAQSSSEIPEGLMNNPVFSCHFCSVIKKLEFCGHEFINSHPLPSFTEIYVEAAEFSYAVRTKLTGAFRNFANASYPAEP